MVITKKLKTTSDFEQIKKGDILAVEWHRDSYIGNKRTRFAVYTVYENHNNDGKYDKEEIILQLKNNVYFNYKLFLDPTMGSSNAKSVVLISTKREG